VCLSFGFAGRDVVDGEEEDAPGSQQWTPWPEIDELSCCAENIEEMGNTCPARRRSLPGCLDLALTLITFSISTIALLS